MRARIFSASSRAGRLVGPLCAILVACGDSGPTPLPTGATIAAPTGAQDLASAMRLQSTLADPPPGLRFQWRFGDGTVSDEVAPLHRYERPGDYTVELEIRNETGQAVGARAHLRVIDLALVDGRLCRPFGDTRGWCWQAPQPQGNTILDQALVDDRVVWAVGERGTLLRSGDAGQSWQALGPDLRVDLSRVSAPDARVAWAAGPLGLVLRTPDAGATWQAFSVADLALPDSIVALDARSAWVGSVDGSAHLSVDSGASWVKLAPPATESGLAAVVLRDAGEAWAVLRQTDAPRLWRRSGLAAPWVEQAPPDIDATLRLQLVDLQFDAQGRRLLVGYVTAADLSSAARLRAWWAEAGASVWRAVDLPEPALAGIARTLRLTGDGALHLYSESGTDDMQRSTDLGARWTPVAMPKPVDAVLTAVRPFSALRLTASDSLGRGYLSTDGGARWLQRGSQRAAALAARDLWFFDRRRGIAATDAGTLATADGGRSWQHVPGAEALGLTRLQFSADGSVGWAATSSSRLLRSTDRGQSWQAAGEPVGGSAFAPVDLHFVDAQRGWVVSAVGTPSGSIQYTRDGGRTWQAGSGTVGLEGLRGVRFADAELGVAVGPPGFVMLSRDGGRSWSPRPTGLGVELQRVAFADADTAVAVGAGGAIVRSADRGQTWQPVLSPTAAELRALQFVSASVGYAVGDNGSVITTGNGGRSWRALDTATGLGLFGLHFIDDRTGWVVGQGGAILVTATAGE